MPNANDSGVDFEITADDSQAQTVFSRTNSTLERLEQTAAKVARGIASTMTAVWNVFLRAADAVATFADNHQKLMKVVVAGTAIYVEHQARIDQVITGYRALRLALSPTWMTAAQIATVILVEETMRLAYVYGELAQQQAFQAARNDLNVKQLQELTLAAQDAGKATDFYVDALRSFREHSASGAGQKVLEDLSIDQTQSWVTQLRDVGVAFEGIKDPVEKTRMAIALFGQDAEKYLPYLNARLDDSIDKFNRIGAVLDTQTQKAFIETKDNVDKVTQGFKDLVTVPIEAFWQRVKNGAAEVGRQLTEIALTMALIPFLFSPSAKQLTPGEREQRRRDQFTYEDFNAEFGQNVKQPTNAFFRDRAAASLADLESRRTQVAGFASTGNAAAIARMHELDDQIQVLRRLIAGAGPDFTNPITVAFGKDASAAVDKYTNSLEGLNGELSHLKSRRDEIVKALQGNLTPAEKASAQQEQVDLNRRIGATQSGVYGFEDAKRRLDVFRQSAQSVWSAETQGGGPLADISRRAQEGAITYHKEGHTREIGLAVDTRENIEKELQVRLQALERDSAKKAIEAWQQAVDRRLELETKLFEQRLKYEDQVAERNLEASKAAMEYDTERAAADRDTALRRLEAGGGPQTLAQKVAVEQQKAQIEIDYLDRVEDVKLKLFDIDSGRILDEERLRMQALKYTEGQIDARIAELSQQREDVRQRIQETTETQTGAARENAVIRSATLVRDQYRQIFDSLKRQSEGVFDAMLQKGTSVWQALGSAFKNAILTAIKDIVSSAVARTLMSLFMGGSAASAGAASSPGGGGRSILGGLGGLLGMGGIAVGGNGGGIFSGASGPGDMIFNAAGGGGVGSGGFSRGSFGSLLGGGGGFSGLGGLFGGGGSTVGGAASAPMNFQNIGGIWVPTASGSTTGTAAAAPLGLLGRLKGAAPAALAMMGLPMVLSGMKGTVVIQLDGPATTSLLQGEAVNAIAQNPRVVQGAVASATRASAGRREMLTLQVSPGTLVS